MRLLIVLVLLQALVLVVLVLDWGTGPRPLTIPLQPAVEEHSLRATAAEPAGQIAPIRAVASESESAPAAKTVAVHGRVLAAGGGAAPAGATISFRQAGQWRGATQHEQRYAVVGLSPGRWQVRAFADGFAECQREVELNHDELQVIDLQLERAQCVNVFLLTTDGGSLADAFDHLVARMLRVVVTAEPLAGNLPPTESSAIADLSLGRFRTKIDGGRDKAGAGEPYGVLQLNRPAPVHATLLLHHLVLAAQIVAPAQTELTFTVDPKDVLALLAPVHLRAVDVESGQPIAGARVSLATSQGGGASSVTGPDGTAAVARVPPGINTLEINAKDYEPLRTTTLVTAGAETNLGDCKLYPPVTLRGRLLDGKGNGVTGSVQWTPREIADTTRRVIDRRTIRADGDGAFELRVGRRRYLLFARTTDGLIGYREVDGGSTQVCELRLQPAVEIAVTAPSSTFETYLVQARDAQGVLAAAVAIESRWREQVVRVPPGDYVLEAHTEQGEPVWSRNVAARGGRLQVEIRR